MNTESKKDCHREESSHEKVQKTQVKGHQKIRISGRRISGNQVIRKSVTSCPDGGKE